MLGLIKHLGASVFRVRSHRLKEITYREKQWGDASRFMGGGGWVRLKALMRPYLTFEITRSL